MKELRPEVRAFLENARDADNPTPADRARVRKALFVAVAAGSAAAVLTKAAPAAAQGSAVSGAAAAKGMLTAPFALKVAGMLAISGVIGAAASVLPSHSVKWEPPAQRAEPKVAVLQQPLDSTNTLPLSNPIESDNKTNMEEPAEGQAPAPFPKPMAAPNEPAPSNRSELKTTPQKSNSKKELENTLEEETRGLGEANRALQAGDPERALQLLEEQSRAFDHGELSEEREAARVLSLCKTSREAEAKAALAAFLAKTPNSPLADRVRSACKETASKN